MDLSLVLPCYNEEPILRENLEKTVQVLNLLGLRYELVLVEDCSTDSTRRSILQFVSDHPELPTQVVLHEKNQGRGAAFMNGVAQSRGAIVGFIDVDLEISPVYIVECVQKVLYENCDLVLGKRSYKYGLNLLHRVFMSRCYSRLVSIILGIPKELDSESGYKFFRRSVLMQYAGQFLHAGWFWDTEVVSRFVWGKRKVASVPCLYIRNTKKRSTVRPVRDALKYLYHLIDYVQVTASPSFFSRRLRLMKPKSRSSKIVSETRPL